MSDILLTFPVKVYGIYTNAVYDHPLLRPDVDTLTLAQSSSPFQSSQSPSKKLPLLDLFTVAFM